MREEKWQDIKGQIKDDFELLEEKKEPLGEDRPGDKEIIVFNGPIGKMKLEFSCKRHPNAILHRDPCFDDTD